MGVPHVLDDVDHRWEGRIRAVPQGVTVSEDTNLSPRLVAALDDTSYCTETQSFWKDQNRRQVDNRKVYSLSPPPPSKESSNNQHTNKEAKSYKHKNFLIHDRPLTISSSSLSMSIHTINAIHAMKTIHTQCLLLQQRFQSIMHLILLHNNITRPRRGQITHIKRRSLSRSTIIS